MPTIAMKLKCINAYQLIQINMVLIAMLSRYIYKITKLRTKT